MTDADQDNASVIVIEEGGIKIRTDKMVTDVLYHCIFDEKVFLFYRDEEGILHCYEVGDPQAAKEIIEKPSEIENILAKYSRLKKDQRDIPSSPS